MWVRYGLAEVARLPKATYREIQGGGRPEVFNYNFNNIIKKPPSFAEMHTYLAISMHCAVTQNDTSTVSVGSIICSGI